MNMMTAKLKHEGTGARPVVLISFGLLLELVLFTRAPAVGRKVFGYGTSEENQIQKHRLVIYVPPSTWFPTQFAVLWSKHVNIEVKPGVKCSSVMQKPLTRPTPALFPKVLGPQANWDSSDPSASFMGLLRMCRSADMSRGAFRCPTTLARMVRYHPISSNDLEKYQE